MLETVIPDDVLYYSRLPLEDDKQKIIDQEQDQLNPAESMAYQPFSVTSSMDSWSQPTALNLNFFEQDWDLFAGP